MKNQRMGKKNPTFNINLLNATSSVSNPEIQSVMAVLQQQLDQHFSPVWGIAAKLNLVARQDANVPTLHILQSSSQIHNKPGGNGGITLGYHDITMGEEPYGFVFVDDTTQAGFQWSSTASHELMELVLDPYAGTWYDSEYQRQLAYFAYETCDPVQNNVYNINNVQVSNFIFPSWFFAPNQGTSSTNQWDFMKILAGPLQVSDGGDAMLFFQVGKMLSLQTQIASSSESAASSSNPTGTTVVRARSNPKAHVVGSRWWRRWKHVT